MLPATQGRVVRRHSLAASRTGLHSGSPSAVQARAAGCIMRTMRATRWSIDRQKVAEFCQRHRIRRLALFGSILRDDFGPHSDIDVLAEFVSGARVGWDFVAIQDELTGLLGRPVDLLTVGAIRPAYRDEILREAEDVYVAP